MTSHGYMVMVKKEKSNEVKLAKNWVSEMCEMLKKCWKKYFNFLRFFFFFQILIKVKIPEFRELSTTTKSNASTRALIEYPSLILDSVVHSTMCVAHSSVYPHYQESKTLLVTLRICTHMWLPRCMHTPIWLQ